MRHEDYKQLLALEAVGALEGDERARLEGHLHGCAECREELRELADAAASLAYTVAPAQPSPDTTRFFKAAAGIIVTTAPVQTVATNGGAKITLKVKKPRKKAATKKKVAGVAVPELQVEKKSKARKTAVSKETAETASTVTKRTRAKKPKTTDETSD